MLAILLLEANRVASVDRFVDALWGDRPSERPVNTLPFCISNLRRLIVPDRAQGTESRLLVNREPGYLLRVSAVHFDPLSRGSTPTCAGRCRGCRRPVA